MGFKYRIKETNNVISKIIRGERGTGFNLTDEGDYNMGYNRICLLLKLIQFYADTKILSAVGVLYTEISNVKEDIDKK